MGGVFGNDTLLPGGRWRNILLAQTITLSLNVRLDTTLPDLPLCELIIMIPALPGPDGIRGTEDDVPDNENPRFADIPASVLDALTELGLPHTAGGALELANRALAGTLPDEVSATLGEIAGTVGSINDIVDACALTIHCANTQDDPDVEISEGAHESFKTDDRVETFGFFLKSRNPATVGSGLRVMFRLPERSRVDLALYNLRGQKVTAVPEQVTNSGEYFTTVGLDHRNLASGVYFLRMEASGLETGQRFAQTRKVTLIR